MRIASFKKDSLSIPERPYRARPEIMVTMGVASRLPVDQSPRPRVVCFSQDPILGETRRLVLQRRYDVVVVSSLEELSSLSAGAPFDVIVLCHTVSAEDGERCLQFTHLVWPKAKVVAVTVNGVSSQPEIDLVVIGLAGPMALLNTVGQVLESGRSARLQS